MKISFFSLLPSFHVLKLIQGTIDADVSSVDNNMNEKSGVSCVKFGISLSNDRISQFQWFVNNSDFESVIDTRKLVDVALAKDEKNTYYATLENSSKIMTFKVPFGFQPSKPIWDNVLITIRDRCVNSLITKLNHRKLLNSFNTYPSVMSIIPSRISSTDIPGHEGTVDHFDELSPILMDILLNEKSLDDLKNTKLTFSNFLSAYHKFSGFVIDSSLIDYVTDPPSSFDPRIVHPECFGHETVLDQGNCGSCWAMSFSASITHRTCIRDASNFDAKNNLLHLASPVSVTSCNESNFYAGCEGKLESNPFKFATRMKIPTFEEVPYTARCINTISDVKNSVVSCSDLLSLGMKAWQLPCNCIETVGINYGWSGCLKTSNKSSFTNKDSDKSPSFSIKSTYDIPQLLSMENFAKWIKLELVHNGPFPVIVDFQSSGDMDAAEDYMLLFDVSTPSDKDRSLHSVTVIGYENNEYWILKNSWGGNVHDDGIFKVPYNVLLRMAWYDGITIPLVDSMDGSNSLNILSRQEIKQRHAKKAAEAYSFSIKYNTDSKNPKNYVTLLMHKNHPLKVTARLNPNIFESAHIDRKIKDSETYTLKSDEQEIPMFEIIPEFDLIPDHQDVFYDLKITPITISSNTALYVTDRLVLNLSAIGKYAFDSSTSHAVEVFKKFKSGLAENSSFDLYLSYIRNLLENSKFEKKNDNNDFTFYGLLSNFKIGDFNHNLFSSHLSLSCAFMFFLPDVNIDPNDLIHILLEWNSKIFSDRCTMTALIRAKIHQILRKNTSIAKQLITPDFIIEIFRNNEEFVESHLSSLKNAMNFFPQIFVRRALVTAAVMYYNNHFKIDHHKFSLLKIFNLHTIAKYVDGTNKKIEMFIKDIKNNESVYTTALANPYLIKEVIHSLTENNAGMSSEEFDKICTNKELLTALINAAYYENESQYDNNLDGNSVSVPSSLEYFLDKANGFYSCINEFIDNNIIDAANEIPNLLSTIVQRYSFTIFQHNFFFSNDIIKDSLSHNIPLIQYATLFFKSFDVNTIFKDKPHYLYIGASTTSQIQAVEKYSLPLVSPYLYNEGLNSPSLMIGSDSRLDLFDKRTKHFFSTVKNSLESSLSSDESNPIGLKNFYSSSLAYPIKDGRLFPIDSQITNKMAPSHAEMYCLNRNVKIEHMTKILSEFPYHTKIDKKMSDIELCIGFAGRIDSDGNQLKKVIRILADITKKTDPHFLEAKKKINFITYMNHLFDASSVKFTDKLDLFPQNHHRPFISSMLPSAYPWLILGRMTNAPLENFEEISTSVFDILEFVKPTLKSELTPISIKMQLNYFSLTLSNVMEPSADMLNVKLWLTDENRKYRSLLPFNPLSSLLIAASMHSGSLLSFEHFRKVVPDGEIFMELMDHILMNPFALLRIKPKRIEKKLSLTKNMFGSNHENILAFYALNAPSTEAKTKILLDLAGSILPAFTIGNFDLMISIYRVLDRAFLDNVIADHPQKFIVDAISTSTFSNTFFANLKNYGLASLLSVGDIAADRLINDIFYPVRDMNLALAAIFKVMGVDYMMSNLFGDEVNTMIEKYLKSASHQDSSNDDVDDFENQIHFSEGTIIQSIIKIFINDSNTYKANVIDILCNIYSDEKIFLSREEQLPLAILSTLLTFTSSRIGQTNCKNLHRYILGMPQDGVISHSSHHVNPFVRSAVSNFLSPRKLIQEISNFVEFNSKLFHFALNSILLADNEHIFSSIIINSFATPTMNDEHDSYRRAKIKELAQMFHYTDTSIYLHKILQNHNSMVNEALFPRSSSGFETNMIKMFKSQQLKYIRILYEEMKSIKSIKEWIQYDELNDKLDKVETFIILEQQHHQTIAKTPILFE